MNNGVQNMKNAILVSLLLGLSAAPAAAQSITAAIPADIRSSNPGVNRDDYTDAVVLHSVEGLVGYKEDGTVGPLLAQDYQLSPDGLTYTFKLRSGVTFHNGEALTADDVLWSWSRYMDPKTEWRCLPEFDGRNGLKVESVTASDPQTIVMKINHRSAIFLDTLARTDCGMTAILQKASVKADGSWDKPIGTGPYKFGDWKRGEYITLDAFENYTSPAGEKADGYIGAKRPLIKEIKFLVVPDPATVKAGLLSGALDIASVLSTDIPEFSANPNFVVTAGAEASKHTFLMQTKDPLLSKVELRQAIAAALDLPTLVAQATNGSGQPNNSAIFPGSRYYSDTQKEAFTPDPTKVAELLAKAGYKGEEITIIANKRPTAPSFDAAVVAQAMLQAVGINVRIEVLDWSTQLDRYNSGKYQMMSFSYSARLDPALSFEQFSGPKDKQPRKVWDNPEALGLIAKAMEISDQSQRQGIFDQLHKQLLHDVPLIIYCNGTGETVSSKRLKGIPAWQAKLRLWELSVEQ